MGCFVPPLAGSFCSISSALSPQRSETKEEYYLSFVCLRQIMADAHFGYCGEVCYLSNDWLKKLFHSKQAIQ